MHGIKFPKIRNNKITHWSIMTHILRITNPGEHIIVNKFHEIHRDTITIIVRILKNAYITIKQIKWIRNGYVWKATTIPLCALVRRVRRYQRGNQNSYIGVGQATQWEYHIQPSNYLLIICLVSHEGHLFVGCIY